MVARATEASGSLAPPQRPGLGEPWEQMLARTALPAAAQRGSRTGGLQGGRRAGAALRSLLPLFLL